MNHYLCAFVQDHWHVSRVPLSITFTPMACRLPSGSLLVMMLVAGADDQRAALLTAVRELQVWMPFAYRAIDRIGQSHEA